MKECVLITSVIHTTEFPLNYSKTRSIYSHKERFEQTLETIQSVRTYLPDADIMIIECSKPSEYINELSKQVNHFINLEFNEVVNQSKEKGKGEATLLLHALSFLNDKYDAVYKLTGRYVLQPSFDTVAWTDMDKLTACRTAKYGMVNGIHTFFYKIPNSYIPLLSYMLTEYITKTSNEAIENFIASRLSSFIKFVDHIGILVRWACYAEQPIF